MGPSLGASFPLCSTDRLDACPGQRLPGDSMLACQHLHDPSSYWPVGNAKCNHRNARNSFSIPSAVNAAKPSPQPCA